MMPKVLITGATGFLGGHVARKLHQLGYAVTATGRNKEKGAKLEQEGIPFVRCDLSDTETVIQMCAGQNIVIHCGALSSTWGKYDAFYNSNVIGTKNILQGCRKYNVERLVYVSTPSLYVDFTDRCHVKETDPLPVKAASAYAYTKRLAEQEVDRAFAAGLATITIRPRAIFGPEDQAIVPRLLAANRQGRIPFIDGGQALIDLTYIDNAVAAILACVHSPEETFGRKYNITNGQPLPFIDLVQQLFTQLGEPLRGKPISYRTAYTVASMLEWIYFFKRSKREPPLTRNTVAMLGKSLTLDITAAKKELKYSPKISINEGIAAYVNWYREQQARIQK